jgi:hypothetical protein
MLQQQPSLDLLDLSTSSRCNLHFDSSDLYRCAGQGEVHAKAELAYLCHPRSYNIDLCM